MQNISIIANPVAGGGKGKARAEAMEKALIARGLSVDLFLTEKAGDAEAHAATLECDVVVSVGGDGTANEVINGLGDKQIALAILPMGSANVVARELQLPKDPEALAELIMDKRIRFMDVGSRNGRRFLLGAGAGLDAAITHQVQTMRGKKSSVWRWVIPAIKTILGYTYPKIRVTVAGRVITETAEYAIVGNCKYSAGIFSATPRSKLDDGFLDVCLVHDLNPWRLICMAVLIWFPGFVDRDNIIYVKGKEILFEPAGEESVLLQVDGDPAGELPMHFSVLPRALPVVTPRGTGPASPPKVV